MTTIDLILPRPHAAQRRILDEAKRYNVAACGRRFGKSTLGYELLTRPALAGYPVGWFAPTYKLLIEVWKGFVSTLRPVTRRTNSTERRIELITGGVLEFWTLENADAGRSRKYQRVFIDEAGLVADLGARWQEAIRPTLADLQGDAWFAGTPKGRNFFWECFERPHTSPDWMAWQMPTSANPHISTHEIDAMREELPERRFQQEIEAAFLDDAGGVFRRVRAAVSADAPVYDPTHQYVIGGDWGRSIDFTVFVVVDCTAQAVVAVDRSQSVDYVVQRDRLRALWERWGKCPIIAEQNSIGQPILEMLQREQLPVRGFTTSNASKALIIENLALAFERSAITLPDAQWLVAELEAFEASRLPSGLTRYAAPEGMHDDGVMALAIAWYGASQPRAESLVDFA